MKKAINICILALLFFLPAITSPYAIEIGKREVVPGRVLLEYGGSYREKTAPVYSLGCRDFTGERSFPCDGGKGKNSQGYGKKINVPIGSYITGQNVPRPLVYDISIDFSGRNVTVLPEISVSNLGIPSTPGGVVKAGLAFLTNLAIHEAGHAVVADYVGAVGSRLSFFKKRRGDFFLGTSSVEYIDDKSKLPYTMGGEFFVDLTFEHALQNYREGPNPYNKALLFYSGTDFLWYCFYAFYLSGDNPYYDPITISKETGISRDALFSIALAKTILNAYRIYSGRDRIIPYFMVDKYSASLNIMIPFELTR
jgi:hypothetical protein